MGLKQGSYSLFDHTADIGIEVKAPSLTALFETAGAALFDIMFESSEEVPAEAIELDLSVTADDAEMLLVRWLSELLFLYDTKAVILREFRVSDVSETCLKARVRGEHYNPSMHALKTEIKAVTYHQIALRRTGESWSARIVLDV